MTLTREEFLALLESESKRGKNKQEDIEFAEYAEKLLGQLRAGGKDMSLKDFLKDLDKKERRKIEARY